MEGGSVAGHMEEEGGKAALYSLTICERGSEAARRILSPPGCEAYLFFILI